MTAHQVDWTYDNGTMRLAAGVEWADPLVRAEVRSDARVLYQAIRRPVVIADSRGEPIETVPAVAS